MDFRAPGARTHDLARAQLDVHARNPARFRLRGHTPAGRTW